MTQDQLNQLIISCRDIIDEVIWLQSLIETSRILSNNELSDDILRVYQQRIEHLHQEYKNLDFS